MTHITKGSICLLSSSGVHSQRAGTFFITLTVNVLILEGSQAIRASFNVPEKELG